MLIYNRPYIILVATGDRAYVNLHPWATDYTWRQIDLYRIFFADFSVNSQPIFMNFCEDCLAKLHKNRCRID